MELEYKEDWEQARERIAAWWQGEVIDRAVIQVTAPKAGSTYVAPAIPDDRLLEWFTDPDCVISRLEQAVAATYWGGEAVPVMFPVSISLVAIPAAYLGCPYTIVPISYSGWASPIITDWATRHKLTFDPQNKWWLLSRQLLQTASQRAPGRYCVGLPDLNGPGELVALLRGPDRLAIDLLEEAVQKAGQNATYHYHLGLAYRAAGKKQLAKQHLERALEINPKLPQAEDIRKSLAAQAGM